MPSAKGLGVDRVGRMARRVPDLAGHAYRTAFPGGGLDPVFWPVLVFGIALLAVAAELLPALRWGAPVVPWQPFFHHLLGGLLVLAFVPVIAHIDKRLKRRTALWLLAHGGGSVLFAAAHIAWVIWLYRVESAVQGRAFHFATDNIQYEYFRELLLYALILAVVRLRGGMPEARAPFQPGRLVVPDRAGLRSIMVEDICWIAAARNYVVLHVAGEEHVYRATMSEMEAMLPAELFIRAHRSAIVNLTRVVALREERLRDHALVMETGACVRVGRQRYGEVAAAFRRGSRAGPGSDM